MTTSPSFVTRLPHATSCALTATLSSIDVGGPHHVLANTSRGGSRLIDVLGRRAAKACQGGALTRCCCCQPVDACCPSHRLARRSRCRGGAPSAATRQPRFPSPQRLTRRRLRPSLRSTPRTLRSCRWSRPPQRRSSAQSRRRWAAMTGQRGHCPWRQQHLHLHLHLHLRPHLRRVQRLWRQRPRHQP